MLKTPRFLLTASLAFALAFTFSCSGDDGDDPPVTLPSSSDAGVSQLPSSPSVAPSSSSEDATLHSSSSHDEELIEVSSSSEEESSSSATAPPPYYPPYIPPVTPSSSSLAYVPCQGREHYGMYKKEFCDERDDHEYVYVEIGEQTWMAQNLNYVVEGSRCYDDDEANCIIYGRLYDWATAMDLPPECNTSACVTQIQSPYHRGICPKGWHIPTQAEWSLQTTIVGKAEEANILSAKSDFWKPPVGTGMPYEPDPGLTDKYGFSALPAGACYYPRALNTSNPAGYQNLGSRTSWWMSTERSSNGYWKDVYNSRGDAVVANQAKTHFISVRCLKD